MDKHQNFVGGKWVDAIDGATQPNGKDMSTYALEDHTAVKHVMARIMRQRAKG